MITALLFWGALGQARQLDFDFGEHPTEILEETHFFSKNIKLVQALPDNILEAWAERDLGFELADGYYGYGPLVYYSVLNSKSETIGYMMVQTLDYSEDPEYHVAYTICDAKGRTVVELKYDVYHYDEVDSLPLELRPTSSDGE